MTTLRLVSGLPPTAGEQEYTASVVRLAAEPIQLRVADPGLLEDAVTDLTGLGTLRSLVVVIEGWRPPEQGWLGRLGYVPDLLDASIAVREGIVTVSLRTARPVSWSVALEAVRTVVRPHRPLPLPGAPVVTVSAGASAALAGARRPSLAAPHGRAVIRTHDVVVTDGPVAPWPESDYGVRISAREGLEVSPGARRRPAVDLRRTNPVGAPLGVEGLPVLGLARIDGTDLVVERPGGDTVLRKPFASSWSAAQVTQVRQVHGATIQVAGGDAPEAWVRGILDLAALGVLLRAPRLPPAAFDALDPAVRSDIEDATWPAGDLSGLEWSVAASSQRRAVLWGHAAERIVDEASAGALASESWPPSVSLLLASRRPDRVVPLLRQLGRQRYPRLEIVVGLHGEHMFTPALRRDIDTAAAALPCRVRTEAFPTSAVFGTVLGRLSAIADGTFVSKVDDDDHYGPDHVADLLLAHRYSGGTLVGKANEFVHLANLDVTRRRLALSEDYAAMVGGGTMFIARADLDELGGWRPVPRGVDRGLLDRVRRSGALVYRTHGIGFLMERRGEGHTWNDDNTPFLKGDGPTWPGLLRHPAFGTA